MCSCFTRYLSGGQHCVFVQAEDSVSHYGLVGQEATAHHLQEEKEEEKITVGIPTSNGIHL